MDADLEEVDTEILGAKKKTGTNINENQLRLSRLFVYIFHNVQI